MTSKTKGISKRFGLVAAVALLAACASVPAFIATAQQTPVAASADTYIHAGRLLADRSLSRLLKADWPKTLAELEERKASRVATAAGSTSHLAEPPSTTAPEPSRGRGRGVNKPRV